MLYLFNYAADQPTTSMNVWLTQEGDAVLVSHTSKDFRANSQGSRLIGTIKDEHSYLFQLTHGNSLTQSGTKYCIITGVQQSADALKSFVSHSKNRRIVLDAIIPKIPVPA